MKCLIRFLLAVLPTALFADTWLEGGSVPANGDAPTVVQNTIAVTNPPAQVSVSNALSIAVTNLPTNVSVTNKLNVTITNEPVKVIVTNEISVVITNIQQGGGAASLSLIEYPESLQFGATPRVTDLHSTLELSITNTSDYPTPVLLIAGGTTGSPLDTVMVDFGANSYTHDRPQNGAVLTYDQINNIWHGLPASGGGAGDNLGNHTATQTLDLDSHSIIWDDLGGLGLYREGDWLHIGTYRETGPIRPIDGIFINPAAHTVTLYTNGSPVTLGGSGSGDNLGNHTATTDLNLGFYSVQMTGPGSGQAILRGVAAGPAGNTYPAFQVTGYDPVAMDFFGASDGMALVYSSSDSMWKPQAINSGGNTGFQNPAAEDLYMGLHSLVFAQYIDGSPGQASISISVTNTYENNTSARPALVLTDEYGNKRNVDFGFDPPQPPQDGDVLTYQANDNTWRSRALARNAALMDLYGHSIIRVEESGQVTTYRQANDTSENALTADITVLVPGQSGPTSQVLHFVNGLFTGMTTPP